jgi:glutathione-independent formaldehyde dehydrogenase
MKAASYQSSHKVSVSDHPKPKLNKPSDALLRVTTSGICGSDLHMYDGRTPLKPGTVVGHEIVGVIVGVIDEVGEASPTPSKV